MRHVCLIDGGTVMVLTDITLRELYVLNSLCPTGKDIPYKQTDKTTYVVVVVAAAA